MRKLKTLRNSVLFDIFTAFCCAVFIASTAYRIINQQSELQKEIKELRADVEELYLRLDNSK